MRRTGRRPSHPDRSRQSRHRRPGRCRAAGREPTAAADHCDRRCRGGRAAPLRCPTHTTSRGTGAPQHLVSAVRAAPGGDTDASCPVRTRSEAGRTTEPPMTQPRTAPISLAPRATPSRSDVRATPITARARPADPTAESGAADRQGWGRPDADQNRTDAGNPTAVAGRRHPHRREAASTDPHTRRRRSDRDRRWWGRGLRHKFGARGEPRNRYTGACRYAVVVPVVARRRYGHR